MTGRLVPAGLLALLTAFGPVLAPPNAQGPLDLTIDSSTRDDFTKVPA